MADTGRSTTEPAHAADEPSETWLRLGLRAVGFLAVSLSILGLIGVFYFYSDGEGELAARLVQAYAIGCAAWTVAWLTGFFSPLLPSRTPSSRVRTVFLAIALVGGWATALAGMLLSNVMVWSPRSVIRAVLVMSVVVGGGAAMGAAYRGWPQLAPRERLRLLLTLQWLVWPILLPNALRFAAMLLGHKPAAAEALLRHSLFGAETLTVELALLVAVTIVGLLSVSRVWQFGQVAGAVGLTMFWTSVVAWITFELVFEPALKGMVG